MSRGVRDIHKAMGQRKWPEGRSDPQVDKSLIGVPLSQALPAPGQGSPASSSGAHGLRFWLRCVSTSWRKECSGPPGGQCQCYLGCVDLIGHRPEYSRPQCCMDLSAARPLRRQTAVWPLAAHPAAAASDSILLLGGRVHCPADYTDTHRR